MGEKRQDKVRSEASRLTAFKLRNRSCEECNRKKSKCDRRTPRCSRCHRMDQNCTYPTQRKRPSFETQYRSFLKKLFEGNKEAELDNLLDQLDPDVLQAAIGRRQARSSYATISPENAVSISPMQSTQQTPTSDLPDLSHDTTEDQPNFAQSPRDNVRSQDPGGSLQEDMHFWPTLNGWDFQDMFMTAPQPEMDFMAPGIDWQQIADSGHMQSALSDSSQSPTALLAEDKTGNSYAIPLPASLVDDLVEMFFERIQCFIPLFHAPNFRAKYKIHDPDESRYCNLTMEEALILNGMLSLSARFVSSPYFGETPSKARAKIFAAKAKALYDEALRLDRLEQSSLPLLQGCILLSFYLQTSRPTTRSWLLIGTCCRLAFDLGLNTLDEDMISSGLTSSSSLDHPEEWGQREEQRRAWWLVWELDIFASTILRRPHGIDKSQMQVLLPVSDTYWFSNTPTSSTSIIADPFQAWNTLNGSLNQDERAWFLVSTFLMATAHDFSLRRNTSAQDLETLESTLDCFSLLLPTEFHLSSGCLSFSESNFASCNWIISTILMVHTNKVLLRRARNAKVQEGTTMDTLSDNTRLNVYNDTELVFRALQAWAPEFIAYACPFIVCTIIGPAFDNVRATHGSGAKRYNVHLEMLKLVVKRVGHYWDIGTAALRLVQILENQHESFEQSDLKALKKSFSLLVQDQDQER